MIEIIGWLHYECGDVYLTFDDPTDDNFDNSLTVACGEEYTGGDKRSYLKEISVIDPSFWDYFTEDELERLIDSGDDVGEDVSFKMLMLNNEIRTLMENPDLISKLEDDEDYDEDGDVDGDETDNNEKKITSKQKTEVFLSSLSSLI